MVNRLIVFAPQWYRDFTTKISGSYRNTTMEGARLRWLAKVDPQKAETLIPKGWYEIWQDLTFHNSPRDVYGNKYLSTPTGIVFDNNEYWYAKKQLYDSSKINMPLLVIRAEWDADLSLDMATGYYQNVTNAPYK